jgi:hypothetical protein
MNPFLWWDSMSQQKSNIENYNCYIYVKSRSPIWYFHCEDQEQIIVFPNNNWKAIPRVFNYKSHIFSMTNFSWFLISSAFFHRMLQGGTGNGKPSWGSVSWSCLRPWKKNWIPPQLALRPWIWRHLVDILMYMSCIPIYTAWRNKNTHAVDVALWQLANFKFAHFGFLLLHGSHCSYSRCIPTWSPVHGLPMTCSPAYQASLMWVSSHEPMDQPGNDIILLYSAAFLIM